MREFRGVPTQKRVGVEHTGRSMQVMEQASTQARTGDHTDGPVYRAGGRVHQQSRQQ